MNTSSSARAARNRLLPAGRVAGPMPWVIAIMMFLTVLAAAAGLAMGQGMRALGDELAGRATIQIVDANPDAREQAVSRLVKGLRGTPGILSVEPVDKGRLAEQIRPWLGADMDSADLPIPALIDVAFAGQGNGPVDTLTRLVRAEVPSARVEPHAAFLGPLRGLVGTLTLIAIALVVLLGAATSAVVVLAARAAHESHRGTIEVLHLMGATDVQIARLFQRRIALDALFGGLLGFLLAVIAIIAVGYRLMAAQSELLGAVTLPLWDWALLAALPLLGIAIATLTARWTVLRALARAL